MKNYRWHKTTQAVINTGRKSSACPVLNYVLDCSTFLLRVPAGIVRSVLSGTLLLPKNTLLPFKIEVLTAVGTTPSHYFCLCPPSSKFPKIERKTDIQALLPSFGSDMVFVWRKWQCSRNLPERSCFRFMWFVDLMFSQKQVQVFR